jgi:oligosaccharide repeat unit polymerase
MSITERRITFARPNGKTLLLWASVLLVFSFAFALIVLSSGMARFAFFALVYIVIAVLVAGSHRHKRKTLDVFDPIYVFPLVFGLYSLASAGYVEVYGVDFQNATVSGEILLIYYVSVLVGLVGFSLGYFKDLSLWRWRALQRPLVVDEKRFRFFLFLLTVILTLVFLPEVIGAFDPGQTSSYATSALSSRLAAREDVAAGVLRYLQFEIPIVFIVASLVLFSRKNVLTRFASTALLLLYVTVGTLSGSRGTLITIVLLALIYRHYRVKRLSIGIVLIPAIILYIFANTLPFVRYTDDPRLMLEETQRRLSSDLTFLSPIYSGEFAGPPMNLMTLIGGIEGGKASFTFGFSILTELLVWVPRPIFPNRPLPLSESFMSLFYPEVYARGGGFGFFIVMEGYWALGVLGVFILMLFFGICLSIAQRLVQINLRSNAIVIIYAAIYYNLVIASTRTGFIGTIKGSLMILLPLLIPLLLARFRLRVSMAPPHLRSEEKPVSSTNS